MNREISAKERSPRLDTCILNTPWRFYFIITCSKIRKNEKFLFHTVHIISHIIMILHGTTWLLLFAFFFSFCKGLQLIDIEYYYNSLMFINRMAYVFKVFHSKTYVVYKNKHLVQTSLATRNKTKCTINYDQWKKTNMWICSTEVCIGFSCNKKNI